MLIRPEVQKLGFLILYFKSTFDFFKIKLIFDIVVASSFTTNNPNSILSKYK